MIQSSDEVWGSGLLNLKIETDETDEAGETEQKWPSERAHVISDDFQSLPEIQGSTMQRCISFEWEPVVLPLVRRKLYDGPRGQGKTARYVQLLTPTRKYRTPHLVRISASGNKHTKIGLVFLQLCSGKFSGCRWVDGALCTACVPRQKAF